jgi:hypothetical protein
MNTPEPDQILSVGEKALRRLGLGLLILGFSMIVAGALGALF